jgi:hypothetical protein
VEAVVVVVVDELEDEVEVGVGVEEVDDVEGVGSVS